VVIDNRGGTGGSIGAAAAAKMPNDGYNLVFANVGAMTLNTVLYKNLGYDPLKDFDPVCTVAAVPNFLLVHPESPYKTLDDLIKAARAKPGHITYSSTGIGASPWLGSELLKKMARVDITEVTFKGAGAALTAVLGKQTDWVLDAASAIQMVKGGRARALGVTSSQRVPAMADVPTIAEQGYPGFDVVAWYGFWAPAGTPPEVVKRLNAEINAILKLPDVVEKLGGVGAQLMGGNVEDFRTFHRAEFDKWVTFVKEQGIKPQ
jgi:tripartite-type tricarboxylate transporter receptor subunit TctC